VSLSKNLRVLIDLLLAGPVLTLLLTPLIVLEVVFAYQAYDLSFGEVAIALIGATAMFAFMKASLLLVFHDVVYRRKFGGSPFAVAALTCLLLLIALAAIADLGRTRADGLSTPDRIIMLGGAYVFFTVGLWLGTRMMHWLLRREED
jgi:hypothetical protein